MISFEDAGWDDYLYWWQTDRMMLRKINLLIADMLRDPFDGSGKPEPLKNKLKGFWSRRITNEHRIVYCLQGDAIIIAQCRSPL